MGAFYDFTSWISRQASIFTVGVLGFISYIWGDDLFCCPCKSVSSRYLYSFSLALSPALLLFVFDMHWKAARASWNINKCHLSCIILRRPIILAATWMVFSMIQPKFSECLTQNDNCTSQAEERKGDALTYTALTVLVVSSLVFFVYIGWNIGIGRTFLSNRPSQNNLSDISKEENKLKKHLKGLSPKILSAIVDEDLMNEKLLKNHENIGSNKLKDKLSIGQIAILQEIREKMNSDTGNAADTAATGDQSACSSCWSCCCCHENKGFTICLKLKKQEDGIPLSKTETTPPKDSE